ncbi:electron transport complex subunit RsxC [Saccharobesus litoralis]|uniref:Ion-translocating oxidoreductase complex subunit C n=1 Tax=Saccharobesus litoralis TaxID=2172099 RepID=A0A2S0VUI3_9ALTE|nr:electron transport complex subunit RsxC [Saccharobesus litoralis]AWB67865.1 electron transport complex subunit RsxC [Saccharobesus litoralis]
MNSLLDKIRAGVLWDFPGGVFPPERKERSIQTPISQIALAPTYWVPVKQHIGKHNAVLVNTGDKVKKGQVLTSCEDTMAVPVHAPTSGTVGEIEPHVSAHPSGLPTLAIEIIADGQDEWCDRQPFANFHSFDKIELIHKIKQAGIAGLGGAAFPTHIKQSPNHPCEILIINGIECEPYITADDMLMREKANEIINGIEVLNYLLEPQLVVIAIEDNKREALNAMDNACQGKTNFVVRSIPTKYPAGGEKQLIQVITNQEIPSGKVAADIGIVTQNIGTTYAIYNAIYKGEPLIERVVTLTGEQVTKPGNYWLPIGTPIHHVLSQVGHMKIGGERVIMGGPMMGFAVQSHQVPVTKITNCLLVPSEQELPAPPPEQPCIRCSACADVCPASLLPQQLFWHSKAKEYDKAQDYKLFDCIECGACAYECPSDIPLVQYYRQAKADIRIEQEEKRKADIAKQRFEARNERLERDKQERMAKHKQAADARKQSLNSDQSAKDKIAAALARAQAKKAQQTNQTNDTTEQISSENASTEKASTQQAPSTIGKQADSNSVNTATADTNKNDNQPPQDAKSKAQAAIERAKAKRLQKNNGQEPTSSPDTSELTAKDKAKAAIERAKLKRLQEQQASENPVTSSTSTKTSKHDELPESQPQAEQSDVKSRAQAAIARAKAKKAAQQTNSAPTSEQDAEVEEQTAIKQKAQQAIARAKAKRQNADNATQSASSHVEQSQVGQTEALSKDENQSVTSAQARAKAAIAKAKAKRLAEQSSTDFAKPVTSQAENTSSSNNTDLSEDDKKARVQAAIAKAKAKKQAETSQLTPASNSPEPNVSSEPNVPNGTAEVNEPTEQQRRIKAAIEKAKAKRIQEQSKN